MSGGVIIPAIKKTSPNRITRFLENNIFLRNPKNVNKKGAKKTFNIIHIIN